MTNIVAGLMSFFVPFSITLFILPRLASIASELGLVDHPNRRKVHNLPKPLVGGLGMSLGVAFACLLFLPLTNMRGYYAGAILLVVIGFFDDFREIHHRMKFIAQILSAILVIYFSNVSLHTFGELLYLWNINFDALTVPMTVIGFVGVINAINMVDGVDGLAGGISLISFISFAYLAYLDNHRDTMMLSIALSGALIAFMRYNWHPSRLFMGDAGSLFLGFSAAFVSIVLTQEPNSVARPVAPLISLTVPIDDTLTVMIKRLMKGKSPFYPDKKHLHHVLLKFGFSKLQTVAIILGLSAVFSSIALAGTLLEVPEYYLFYLFLTYFFSYFIASFFIRNILLKRKRNSRLRAKIMLK
ncbi:MAG: undecaprenyl/decaprenyl-phosphate alpha-N-acetylglucosaminyl 1-phosphate transferase [Nitrospirae bacterium]|nr:undecaprenyl/decaprenyl-phosphate alpha-N-acetylglucosaminyl 1-phosphate transferase [Nitrospirota bacterium]